MTTNTPKSFVSAISDDVVIRADFRSGTFFYVSILSAGGVDDSAYYPPQSIAMDEYSLRKLRTFIDDVLIEQQSRQQPTTNKA